MAEISWHGLFFRYSLYNLEGETLLLRHGKAEGKQDSSKDAQLGAIVVLFFFGYRVATYRPVGWPARSIRWPLRSFCVLYFSKLLVFSAWTTFCFASRLPTDGDVMSIKYSPDKNILAVQRSPQVVVSRRRQLHGLLWHHAFHCYSAQCTYTSCLPCLAGTTIFLWAFYLLF